MVYAALFIVYYPGYPNEPNRQEQSRVTMIDAEGGGGSPMTDPDFLTVEEVAERCRVSDQTVRNWIDSGNAPPMCRDSLAIGTEPSTICTGRRSTHGPQHCNHFMTGGRSARELEECSGFSYWSWWVHWL